MALNEAVDLRKGKLFPKIIKFMLPVMLSGFVQLLFNAADVAVVGQFCGRTSVSAVSSNGSLITLIVNMFVAMNVGVNVLVSNFYGAKDKDGVNRAANTTMIISVIVGVVIGAVGFFFSDFFLSFMNVPFEVFPKSVTYLRIYFIGVPFNLIYNFGATVITASGDSVRPLKYIISSGAINVVLNIVFVRFFNMDVAGVAWATVISTALSGVLVILRLTLADEWYKIDIRKLSFNTADFKKIMQIGLPAGLQSTCYSIANVIFQASVNSFGDACMSGNGSAGTIEGFVYVIIAATSQSSLNFTSYAVGSGEFEYIKKSTRINVLLGVCATALINVFVVFFKVTLLSIYLPGDTEAIAWGVGRLYHVCIWYSICAVGDTLMGSIRAMGVSVTPMLVSLVGICGFRILWIMIVFAAFPTNIYILYLIYPISWTITSVAHFITYMIVKKRYTPGAFISKRHS